VRLDIGRDRGSAVSNYESLSFAKTSPAGKWVNRQL
jgi:hypothetical protein